MTATDPLAKYRKPPAGYQDQSPKQVEAESKTDPLVKYRKPPGELELEKKPEEQESNLKTIFRYMAQAPAGIAQAITYPLDILKAGAQGAARESLQDFYDPGEESEREKALQIAEGNLDYFPTQGSAEKLLEKHTGLPIVPKTKGQKFLRLGATAATLNPGGTLLKGQAAVTAPAGSALLQEAGVPEELADVGGLGISTVANLVKAGVNRLLPKSRESNLASRISSAEPDFPPGGPSPTVRTKDTAAQFLSSPEIPAEVPPAPRLQRQLPQVQGEARPLSERTIQQQRARNLGLRVQRPNTPENPLNTMGNAVSETPIHNTTTAGVNATRVIRNADEEAYRHVNELYNQSRGLNSEIQDIHPQLVGQLQNRIAEIDAIAHPSGPQVQLRRAMEDQLNRLATLDEAGNITGFTPVSNQSIIDQIQASRHSVDYDFGHGKPKNIFKPFINDLQTAAINSAERINPEAATSLREAQSEYRDWVTTFDNDYVRHFRDTSNHSYSKNLKGLYDKDNYNIVRHILESNPEGTQISSAIRREMFEDKLSPFFKDPRKADIRQFDKTLRELSVTSTPEEIARVRQTFMESRRSPNFIARKPEKPTLRAAQKAINITPEQIESKLNTVSGVRDLREKLPENIRNSLFKDATKDIMHSGKMEHQFTGNDLNKILNDRKNFEILSEMHGSETVEKWRQAAKEIGDQQVKLDTFKAVGKKIAGVKALTYIFPLLPI